MKFAAGALLALSLIGAALLALAPVPLPETTVAAWPVVRGSIGGDPAQWYVAFEQGEGVQLCTLEHSEGLACQELSGMSLGELRTMPLNSWAKGSTLWLEERFDGFVPPELVRHSSYVTQLVRGSLAPDRGSTFEPAVAAALENFLDVNLGVSRDGGAPRPVAPGDALKWIQTWARSRQGDDALFEAFIRHEAIGTCSQDATPQLIATLFGELAFARGEFPTFFDLRLRLMRNSFDRVAWSSFAEKRQPTGADRLTGTGVDLDELFLGLLIRHPGAKGSVDDWRLARAIRETGRTAVMLPQVEALATMSSLDAYNRFRATEVWLHLQVYDEATQPKLQAVKAAGTRLDLHPVARLRLDAAF